MLSPSIFIAETSLPTSTFNDAPSYAAAPVNDAAATTNLFVLPPAYNPRSLKLLYSPPTIASVLISPEFSIEASSPKLEKSLILDPKVNECSVPPTVTLSCDEVVNDEYGEFI